MVHSYISYQVCMDLMKFIKKKLPVEHLTPHGHGLRISKKQPLHTSNQPSPPKTPLEHSLFGHPLLSLRYAKGSCVPRSMVLELVSVDTETSGSFLHNSGGATSQLKTLEIFTNSLWFLYEWMGRTIMVEKI